MVALSICSVLCLGAQALFARLGIPYPFLTPLFAMGLAFSQLVSRKVCWLCEAVLVLAVAVQTYVAYPAWTTVACWFISAGVWWLTLPLVSRLFFRWEFDTPSLRPLRFGWSVVKVSFCSTLPFFVFSNFVCWLQMSSAGSFLPAWLTFQPYYYTGDFPGLVNCYLMALPFYARQLAGTVVFFGAFQLADRWLVPARFRPLDRFWSMEDAQVAYSRA